MTGRGHRALAAAAVLAAAASAAALAAPAQAATRRFSKPVHVDVTPANQTGEPSIAVARDGTEYVVAPAGPGTRVPGVTGTAGAGGSLVWRSSDRGRSWTFLGSYDLPTGGGDTDIAVAPNGTLYASGLSYAACATLGVSTDRGDSWHDDPVAGCGTVPVHNDRQWTAVRGNSTVYTTIGDTLGGGIDLIRTDASVAATPGAGLVFATPLELWNGDYQWPGTVAVDQRRGTAYVTWNTTDDRIFVSAVPDGATTAPTPAMVAKRTGFETFDSFTTDAVDAAGTVYVTWSERHPAQQQTWIMLSSSRNGGRTWSAPVRVGRSSAAVFPWVTAGDAGRIAVSYYGTTATGKSAEALPAQAQWQVFSAFSTDGGRSFATYRTTPTMQHGSICTSGTGCAAGTRNLLDFFESAIDPQGCLVTAYADNSSGSPIVSYVRQTAGPGLLSRRSCR